MAGRESEPRLISSKQRIGRQTIAQLRHGVFRGEIALSLDGREKAEQLAQEGYGTLILVTHATKGEMQRYISDIFTDPATKDRPVLVPIAVHQFKPYMKLGGRITGVENIPIVNDDTFKYVEDQRKLAEQGNKKAAQKVQKYEPMLGENSALDMSTQYMERAIDTLRDGGVVLLAPQGGRRPILDETTMTTAVSSLIRRTDRNRTPHTKQPMEKVDKFVVLFGTFRLPGADMTDEKTRDSMHIGKKFKMKYGRALTKEELLREAKAQHITVDDLILQELQRISPHLLPKLPYKLDPRG